MTNQDPSNHVHTPLKIKTGLAYINSGFQDLPDFISDNCSEVTEKDRSYLIVENLNAVKRDPNDYLQIYRNRQGAVTQVARSASHSNMSPSSLRGC